MKKEKITVSLVREELKKNQDPKYREFLSRLLPGTDNILGVRLPVLRKIAKHIGKNDWKEWFNQEEAVSYEETMLKGLVSAGANMDCRERLSYVEKFVPAIDNWGVCDSFCASLKDAKKEPKLYWEFLKPYFNSGKEYDARFGAVMLLFHFVSEEYLWDGIRLLESIKNDGYYAKMAAAWAISVYFAAFPEEMYEYLSEQQNLDEFTYKKSLQKILESNRVTGDIKNRIKELRQRG